MIYNTTFYNTNNSGYRNKTALKPTFQSRFNSNAIGDILEIKGTQTKAKVFTTDIDFKTYEQIKNICSHPVFKDEPVRIMPDTHLGRTAVVGFSAPSYIQKGIIPSLMGGDIGCGMLCVEVDTKGKEIDFDALDNIIKNTLTVNKIKEPNIKNKYVKNIDRQIENTCKDYRISSQKSFTELGTLGGGNHFIELDKDRNNRTFLIIHTGSREFGKEVFNHHDKIAREQNPYIMRDLSYLTNDEAKKYISDMKLALKYAQINRRIIADEILKKMDWAEKDSFESVHNYIAEDGIVRKGAIKAYSDEKILIPLNMKDGAIIAKGKGNPDWNNSAPHGAGRQFSRSEASELIDLEDYKNEMNGIHASHISKSTIDESPMAYKDPNNIINNITDTAEIEDIIKPIYNYKG